MRRPPDRLDGRLVCSAAVRRGRRQWVSVDGAPPLAVARRRPLLDDDAAAVFFRFVCIHRIRPGELQVQFVLQTKSSWHCHKIRICSGQEQNEMNGGASSKQRAVTVAQPNS